MHAMYTQKQRWPTKVPGQPPLEGECAAPATVPTPPNFAGPTNSTTSKVVELAEEKQCLPRLPYREVNKYKLEIKLTNRYNNIRITAAHK